MRIMKYDLKVPILCRSGFHNRIYSLSCAKICYNDTQHGFWLLHRILDHMTPWISFYFLREVRFGAIVARRFMSNKLYNKLSTEFCLFYQFITQKLTSKQQPRFHSRNFNSSAVPEIWKTQPGPFRQSSNLCRSLMTRKMGKIDQLQLGKACIIQTPNIYNDILNYML